MITLNHLSKRFGEVLAVNDVTLDIHEGEILGFLGPNGAGKTTCIRMLCGLLDADEGHILWGDEGDTARRDVGLCSQENIYWPKLTCFEQLVFAGEMYRLSRSTLVPRARYLLETLGLTEKQDVLAENLSGGMKRRLNIALALIHDPAVLVLDEPEAGLDPQSRILVRDLIRSLARQKTIILTTHNMDEAERLADRVAIIDHGKLLKVDTLENLKQLTGDGDLLEIELHKLMDTDKTRLLELVKTRCGAECLIQLAENRLQLRSKKILNKVSEITRLLEEQQLEIGSMQLRKSTLEDVFIHLTGRGLRE